MAKWRLDHGLERSSTASVQVTLFGRPDCTGTLRLSTAMARRSEGRAFCDVRIAEDSGRRAGLATVVLAAGRPAPSRGPVDAHGPAFEATGDGVAAMRKPSIAGDLDVDGRVHEGAVLTLIDAAATRAVHAAAGSERCVLAVSLHASVSHPLPAAELSARAAIRTCDGQSAWCDVEVVGLADRRLYGVGTIVALI
jgi:acyl-coenzyme A thioesterase PaaI-like protein